MGRLFCENFLILVKCPLDSSKKSDWFRCEKISQKLKYLNFKCEQSERYFSSCSVRFTTLCISHANISLATSEKPDFHSHMLPAEFSSAKIKKKQL